MKTWMSLFLLLTVTHFASAGDINLIANGKAYHFDRETSLNEKNWGFGLQYTFDSSTRNSPFITLSSFKDSFDNTSNYLGAGMQRRYFLNKLNIKSHVDIGIMAFAMTRKNYDDGKPFLGAIPFVSIGNENFAVNMTFIPELSFNESPLMFFQFMFSLGAD